MAKTERGQQRYQIIQTHFAFNIIVIFVDVKIPLALFLQFWVDNSQRLTQCSKKEKIGLQ